MYELRTLESLSIDDDIDADLHKGFGGPSVLRQIFVSLHRVNERLP